MTTIEKIKSYFIKNKAFVLPQHEVSRSVKALLHWKILLGLFLVFVVGVLYSGIAIFWQIETGRFLAEGEKPAVDASTLTLNLIDEVVTAIEEENLSFEAVRESGETPVDPSQ